MTHKAEDFLQGVMDCPELFAKQLADQANELEQLRVRLKRQPLSAGREPSIALHTKPLLISWHPESKAMTISTLDRFFTHTVATPNSLWDLLVEFHDDEAAVYERETGAKRSLIQQPPSQAEQEQWLKDHKSAALPSLDDLDLEL